MPVVTLYRHGVSMGVPPMTNTHKRAKRDVVTGWSAGATRRNLQFLYSIDERDLDGEGFAVTLTLRDCPPTAEDWQYLVKQFFMYLKRILSYASTALGEDFTLLRYHYVTEWQRRGVPHLHAAIYFSPGCTARNNVRSYLLCCWTAYASKFGCSESAQHFAPIHDAIGWCQYVAKHAARGVKHYQRMSANIPEGWTKTGRMWGKGGDWPIKEPVRFDVDNRGYHTLRRWARSWRKADARIDIQRAKDDPRKLQAAHRRIRSARHALRCPDRPLSTVRGVSDWIDDRLTLLMLRELSKQGYPIDSR
jgi:hypothetical protein